MANYTITIDPASSTSTDSVLMAGFVAYNTSKAGVSNRRTMSVQLRDDDGSIVGGLSAVIIWNWMFVSLLYIDDAARRHGYGSALMRAAEREAVLQGCAHMYLDTFSFQARGFYEKLSFSVFGQSDDFPPGHTRYFMKKTELESD